MVRWARLEHPDIEGHAVVPGDVVGAYLGRGWTEISTADDPADLANPPVDPAAQEPPARRSRSRQEK